MMKPVKKILGADVELGNVIEHDGASCVPSDVAARLLLAQIEGIPATSPSLVKPQSELDPQDLKRRYLPGSGGCAYIDLDHLELCIPEVCSALDYLRYQRGNFALAHEAAVRAAYGLRAGRRLVVMANNSDRQGHQAHSWGGHLNVLITRELRERIFDRIYPALLVLVAFQVSSILYTGQGKVGSEGGKPWVPFQLTQRADFFECLMGEQTTHRRPLVNARDEAHTGVGDSGLARLHVIFHDTTLGDGSNFLKAGVSQLVLALMETGWCATDVLLADPLTALTTWGHDPALAAVAPLLDGRQITAIDHQRLFLQAVRPFVESGEAEPFVPDSGLILAVWEDTLDRLERQDFTRLARRLDWVLKKQLLERAIESDPSLDWTSPVIRAADLHFADLDPGRGLQLAMEAAGGADRMVSEAEVAQAMREPPADTRAWTRTMLLRRLDPRDIESVNWDAITLRPVRRGAPADVFCLSDPRRHGRSEAGGQPDQVDLIDAGA